MAMHLRHPRGLYVRPPSPARPSTASSPFPSSWSSLAFPRSALDARIYGSGADGSDLILASLGPRRRGCLKGGGGALGARCSSATAGSGSGWWEEWRASVAAAGAPCLSDVFWPSAGAFLAMALLAKMDQIIAPTGLSFTIAPLGAVCTVLFATPSTPGARKYNMFMAQIGCAAIGVLALSIFGPGWLARSTALAASVAFMIITRAIHPPAAALPILFIDGTKFHNLQFWYALFPGATGCLLLCLLQELVDHLRASYRF